MEKKDKKKNNYILFLSISSDQSIIKLLVEDSRYLLKMNNRKKIENIIKDYQFNNYKITNLAISDINIYLVNIENIYENNIYKLKDNSLNSISWKIIFDLKIKNILSKIYLYTPDNKYSISLQNIIDNIKQN